MTVRRSLNANDRRSPAEHDGSPASEHDDVARGSGITAVSEVRDYLEMKIRTLLTRRKRRRKTSIGWRRWSNAYLYGVLRLFWDWKIHPLPGAATFA